MRAGGLRPTFETVLNADVASQFEAVASSELQPALVQRYQRFRQDFPAVTCGLNQRLLWQTACETLRLRVRGEAESEGLRYRLQATERIAIRLNNGRMVDRG